MAHVAVIRHQRVGNRSKEVGGYMFRGVCRREWTVGKFGFLDIGRREDEDPRFS